MPTGGPRAPRRRRVREVLLGVVARTALFALWAFVLWGSLLVLSLGAAAFEVGPRGALGRLLPERGRSLSSYLNAGAVLLALLAWGLVGAAALANRRPRPPS